MVRQDHGEHATGNGGSGRVGLDLLPTFSDMEKVGPGGGGWKLPQHDKWMLVHMEGFENDNATGLLPSQE